MYANPAQNARLLAYLKKRKVMPHRLIRKCGYRGNLGEITPQKIARMAYLLGLTPQQLNQIIKKEEE